MIMQNKPAEPVVTAINGSVRTTSLDVAAFFGKSHNGVLRIIHNLLDIKPSLGMGLYPHFEKTVLTQERTTGEAPITIRAFELTRDGFMLVAMRFSGRQAVSRVLRYDEAFSLKEEEVYHELVWMSANNIGIDLLRRLDMFVNQRVVRAIQKRTSEDLPQLVDPKFLKRPVKSTCPPEEGKTAKEIWDSTGLPRKIRGSSLWLGNRLAKCGCLIDSDAEGGASEVRLFDPHKAKRILKAFLLETARTYAYERKRHQFRIVQDPE